MRIVLIIILILSFFNSFPNDINRLDSCESQIQRNNYKEATVYLSSYLKQDITHENRAVFYLGIITYNLEYNIKSEAAFLKFLELDREHSDFYDSSLYYLAQIQERTNNRDLVDQICERLGPLDSHIECDNCEGEGVLLAKCSYCQGDGEDLCSNCGGSGVEIEYGSFGSIYKTCHICNGSGYNTCQECNGSGEVKGICHDCEGSGHQQEPRDCKVIAKQLDEIRKNR